MYIFMYMFIYVINILLLNNIDENAKYVLNYNVIR